MSAPQGAALPTSEKAAADELMELIGELNAAAAIVSTRADAQARRAAFLIGWLQERARVGWEK